MQARSRVASSLLRNDLLGCLWLGGRCTLHLLGACADLGWLALNLADNFLSCTLDLSLDGGFLGGFLGHGLLDACASLRAWFGCIGFRLSGLLGRELAGGLGGHGLEDARLGVAGCTAGSGHCDGSMLDEEVLLKSERYPVSFGYRNAFGCGDGKEEQQGASRIQSAHARPGQSSKASYRRSSRRHAEH